jgi:hypothetical protein
MPRANGRPQPQSPSILVQTFTKLDRLFTYFAIKECLDISADNNSPEAYACAAAAVRLQFQRG